MYPFELGHSSILAFRNLRSFFKWKHISDRRAYKVHNKVTIKNVRISVYVYQENYNGIGNISCVRTINRSFSIYM